MRQKVLRILLNQQKKYTSGEAMSQALSVTRAAIWKHIQQLKREGFLIDSIPNKGYRLAAWPDRFEEAILLFLLKNGEMGSAVEIHETIDSTNLRARELAMGDAAQGMLVVAEEQLMGRGRMGRHWKSPKGLGIWMSLVLKPLLMPDEAYKITMLAALAVVSGIHRICGIKASIKWPNDIILGTKKVCGILAEIQAEPEWIHYVVLGIGLNVNQMVDDFPLELSPSATSITLEYGNHVDRMTLAAAILDDFSALYKKLINGDFADILMEYRQACITLGRPIQVMTRTDTYEAYAEAIADNGALMVRLSSGELRQVFSGDVSVRGIGGYHSG